MNITINTDASFNAEKNTGGYAFWISSNAGTFKKYGGLKHCKCCTEAEIKAIANALYYMEYNKDLWGISKIFINTDSKNAIRMIGTPNIPRHKRFKNALKKIRETLKKYPNELRWVKAHSGIEDSRSYVNRYCDKYAKLGRKNLEAENRA